METKFQVIIFAGSDQELMLRSRLMVLNMQLEAIESFANQLNGLRESAISIRNTFREFDFGINLFFNRNILPEEQKDSSV
jgi:hypothetical protein